MARRKRRSRWGVLIWALCLGGCLAGRLEEELPEKPRFPKKESVKVPPAPQLPPWILPEEDRPPFQFLTLLTQGRSRPAGRIILSQLVFKDTALGELSFDTYTVPARSYRQESSFPPFEHISLTRFLYLPWAGNPWQLPITETGPGQEEEEPDLVTVPEPTVQALALAACMVMAVRRCRC